MKRIFQKLNAALSKRYAKATSLFALFIGALFLALPSLAHAAPWTRVVDAIINLPTSIAFGISWVISVILGAVIAYQAWLLEIILSLSLNIVSSRVVQAGFPVTLSLANLAFVLGIILIALATILRNQTYGVKQILWKLVVMAVLVNFGLVLAGGILSFSDNTTRYFLRSISPTGGVGDGGGIFTFATNIAASFSPQEQFLYETDPTKISAKDRSEFDRAFKVEVAGEATGAMLIKPIVSIVITIGVLLVIVIVLAVLAIMLIIRYVEIAVLLVLLPLAWAAWVFPSMKKHWDKWWDKFLKQVFFAPLVVFFLWLGIEAAKGMKNAQEFTVVSPTAGAIQAFFGGLLKTALVPGLQAIVIAGIMMAGIIAAHSMGISFADAAQKGVGKMKSYATGAVGRGARRARTRTFGGDAGQATAKGMQSVGASRGKLIKTLTAPVRQIGRGIEAAGRSGGVEVIEAEKKGLSNVRTEAQLLDEIQSATGPRLIALLDKAKGMGSKTLGKALKAIPENRLDERMDEKMFTRYGQAGLYKEIGVASGKFLRDLSPGGAQAGIINAISADLNAGRALNQNQQRVLDELTVNLKKMGPENFKELLVDDYKDAPLKLKDNNHLQEVQQTMAQAAALVYNGSDISQLYNAASPQQLDRLANAGRAVTATSPNLMHVNARAKKHLSGSGAAAAGYDDHFFGT